MAKDNLKNKNIVSGRNIYIDDHKRTIYFNPRTKQGFVIKTGTETAFKAFYNRYLVGFIAIIFLEIFFFHNLLLSIPLGFAVFAYMEFRWRKLIDSYTMIQDFEPKDHESSFEKVINMDTSAIIVRVLLYVALAVCLVINIYVTPEINESILLTVCSYALCALAVYMAARYIYAISKKQK